MRQPKNKNQLHIDRDSDEPAYAQVVRILTEEIAGGQYHPGDQLPSQSQLRARFDVSGMTIRRAMTIMADHGTVSTSPGKGVFVRRLDMREAAFKLTEPHGDPVSGSQRQVDLLQATIGTADERVARKLAVACGSKVIYLCRLVQDANDPLMYHRVYLIYDPRRPIVEAEVQITSLEGLFSGLDGQGLRRGDLRMEAVGLNQEEAAVLQQPEGTPALCLEHIFYDFENRPVAWGWFICRADRYHLVGRLGPEAALGQE